VAAEAVRNKRRVIVCDLMPIASRITELTLRPVNTTKLLEAFERVRGRVQKRINDLYIVHCIKCGKPLVADCFVRKGAELLEVRYKGCPHCEHRCETRCKPRKKDLDLLEEIERKRITGWYPRNRLYYPDGDGRML
jgi:transcription elongation factor Elf1